MIINGQTFALNHGQCVNFRVSPKTFYFKIDSEPSSSAGDGSTPRLEGKQCMFCTAAATLKVVGPGPNATPRRLDAKAQPLTPTMAPRQLDPPWRLHCSLFAVNMPGACDTPITKRAPPRSGVHPDVGPSRVSRVGEFLMDAGAKILAISCDLFGWHPKVQNSPCWDSGSSLLQENTNMGQDGYV